MAHRTTRSTVRVTVYDSEDRAVEVEARYSAATSDYFDRGFGNWLPGDPEDIEILSISAIDEGADCAEVEADWARVEEAVREAATDEDDDRDYEAHREEMRCR